jgi:hypothetical protein
MDRFRFAVATTSPQAAGEVNRATEAGSLPIPA